MMIDVEDAQRELDKGNLLYLYFSGATHRYEWKAVDPKYYSDGKLDTFREMHSATHELYDNMQDMIRDRAFLNSRLKKDTGGAMITDEELEERASQFYLECERDLSGLSEDELYITGYAAGYRAGEKEGGIVWHDLRKNPDDLPKRYQQVIDDRGHHVFYDPSDDSWWYEREDYRVLGVKAWCTGPVYK